MHHHSCSSCWPRNKNRVVWQALGHWRDLWTCAQSSQLWSWCSLHARDAGWPVPQIYVKISGRHLPGICRSSPDSPQMPCRCPTDALWMLFPERHWPNIYRASTGHLGLACRCLSKKFRLCSLKNWPNIYRTSKGQLGMTCRCPSKIFQTVFHVKSGQSPQN